MFLGLIILAVVAFLLSAVMVANYLVGTYNSLVELKNDIVKAWANIDVLLKQRSDEVPNLVSTVKGYMAHEREVLEAVTQARASVVRAGSVGEKAATNDMLEVALGRLFAVVEAYPELKADESFLELQKRITRLENEIADRREFYNDAVTIFNTRIESYPDRFVAGWMGLRRRPLFKARPRERLRVKTSFTK
ncbi:MAG: LemA family protein [Candidatus Altiarchaeales archaeon]|nr:LemA family protein [Candidatus Altiarchaeales archaeon]MBD3415994.1 LemA family protein [Candidatus Altiarchaeales archaeon]